MEASPDLHRNVGFLDFTLRVRPEQRNSHHACCTSRTRDKTIVEVIGAENERLSYCTINWAHKVTQFGTPFPIIRHNQEHHHFVSFSGFWGQNLMAAFLARKNKG